MIASCRLGEQGCFSDGKCRYKRECPHKVVTNGDRIRAMGDEELAEFLIQFTDIDCTIGFCRNLPECQARLDADEDIPASMCVKCLADWIRKPKDA